MPHENVDTLLKEFSDFLKDNHIKKEDAIKQIKNDILKSVNERVNSKVIAASGREKNLYLNNFEYSSGKITLESVPEGIGIGAHYSCNARCIFCLGGKPQFFSLERYKDFFEPKLKDVISKVRYINFCGFGELFLMPKVEEFLDYINGRISSVNKIFTTNGLSLKKEINLLLIRSKSTVEISLHTSKAQLHKVLTGIDMFDEIIERIKQLVVLRERPDSPSISLKFLINTLNIETLPEFVEFAGNLGVDEVLCDYMKVFNPTHLKLSCFFKQEVTNLSFKRAEEIANKSKIQLKLPPQFGEIKDKDNKFICSDPWRYFYVENEGSVIPCCHAGDHIGYLNKSDFETIWNGVGYKWLRRSLIEGPPHQWCRYCYKYRSSNVNDIRSHVTFRPDLQQKILKGLNLK